MVCVLLFSYLIELLQYFNFVHLLGLEESKIAKIVLGSSFEWLDLVAYTAGGLIIILAEKLNSVKKTTTI
ncbi:DUF2809 domain-containing protein [Flavobacterium sp.]|uniref:ribosomal maturation YjgA family protein n=1 Tax=Flavobacterium sp. TaxID=239 RepID=UPI0028BD1D18|nr:DUF2809 domain-containing protein [Flavobacterium sp.]